MFTNSPLFPRRISIAPWSPIESVRALPSALKTYAEAAPNDDRPDSVLSLKDKEDNPRCSSGPISSNPSGPT